MSRWSLEKWVLMGLHGPFVLAYAQKLAHFHWGKERTRGPAVQYWGGGVVRVGWLVRRSWVKISHDQNDSFRRFFPCFFFIFGIFPIVYRVEGTRFSALRSPRIIVGLGLFQLCCYDLCGSPLWCGDRWVVWVLWWGWFLMSVKYFRYWWLSFIYLKSGYFWA